MRSSLSLSLAVVFASTLAACGGSDDGTGTTIDAASSIDAPPGAIDAAVDAPAATNGLGAACTGMGQGTCGTGLECLSLNGGSGSWCSKPCTGAADMSCSMGYTGPGFPLCLLSVTPAGGGAARTFCLIVCNDPAGAPDVCPGGAAQCNGMCPTPLQCTANLTNMQMQVVATACK